MATIANLAARKELELFKPTLNRYEFPERTLWLRPTLIEWFQTELPKLVQIEPDDLRPALQVRALFRAFVLGRNLKAVKQFRHLRPIEFDVWELKTPDVRVFGWFVSRNEFIAVCADSMERCKVEQTYIAHIQEVLRVRDGLDLDPPKYVPGAGYNDVISV